MTHDALFVACCKKMASGFADVLSALIDTQRKESKAKTKDAVITIAGWIFFLFMTGLPGREGLIILAMFEMHKPVIFEVLCQFGGMNNDHVFRVHVFRGRGETVRPRY